MSYLESEGLAVSRRGVCLVRFHDGTAKSNWGGRATSLALGRIIGCADLNLASVVAGSNIVEGFTPDARRTSLEMAARRLGHRAGIPVRARRRYSAAEWGSLAAAGRRVALSPPSPRAAAVVASLRMADEVWINGEGDLILAERPTLLRTLLIVHMAVALERPVRMVNSILSDSTAFPQSTMVVAAVGQALGKCEEIVYRDPVSLRLHQSLYPQLGASWKPDALFVWSHEARQLVRARSFGPYTEGLPSPVQSLLASREPFVVVSGTSARFDRSSARRGLREVVAELRRRAIPPVIVATDTGDRWMLEIAEEMEVPSVEPTIPLSAGVALLAHAACFVSGRYHPSIMASLAGTPCVFMSSNSHKTLSLQELLDVADPVELPFLGAVPVDKLVDTIAGALNHDRTTVEERAAELAGRLCRP